LGQANEEEERRSKRLKLAGAIVLALALTAVTAGSIANAGGPKPPKAANCKLNGPGAGEIKHVIYLQFDNTHLFRDRAQFASDLELMPHLKSFLEDNGTLSDNEHTILISHTAGGILSSLTGLYPDRHGQAVSNSYGYFRPGGVNFSSSFKYWTDLTDGGNPANSPVSIVTCIPTVKPPTLATFTLVSPGLAAAAVTVGPAPKTIELLFSSTAFAVETFPTSQPARVYGTHGAGVVFGVPESPMTMLGFVSAGGVGGFVAGFPPSVMSVQYLNDDEKPTLPLARKNPYEFVTAWPIRSG